MSSTTDAQKIPTRLTDCAEAAVKKLQISTFLDTHLKTLLDKLLEADANASAAPVDDDMLYVVLSLPVASSVIHLASSRQALAEARRWVEGIWTGADPAPILSTLTLVHLVVLGYRGSLGNPEEEAVWNRIVKRIKKLTEEMAEELQKRAQPPGGTTASTQPAR